MTIWSSEPRDDADDEIVSTDRQTVAEEDEEIESEELGSQETYIYPTKFGYCREYEGEEDGEPVTNSQNFPAFVADVCY